MKMTPKKDDFIKEDCHKKNNNEIRKQKSHKKSNTQLNRPVKNDHSMLSFSEIPQKKSNDIHKSCLPPHFYHLPIAKLVTRP